MQRQIRRWCLAVSVLLTCHLSAIAQDDPFALLFGDEQEIDASGDELRFLGVRLGALKLSDTLTGYEISNGLCVLPKDLLTTLETSFEIEDTRITGWFIAPERTFEINLETAQARLPRQESLDLDGQVIDTEEGWCVGLQAWSKILPIDFSYSSNTLTLIMEPRETLPLEARLEREALRAQLNPDADRVRPNYRSIENPYRWLSLPTADLSVDIRAGSDTAMALTGQVDLSTDFLWTTARIRSAQNRDGSMGVRATLDRVFDKSENQWVPRQVRIGDVPGLNQPLMMRPESGRGIWLTNRPAYRADIFDTTIIRGPLQEGWDAELFRDGQLIDFVERPNEQGEYLFENVDILPGYNRYTVKLYGPVGETEERHVRFFAGSDLNPENRIEYDFALLEEGVTVDGNETSARGFVAAANASAGITQNLTARLDVRAEETGPVWSVASLVGYRGNTSGVVRALASGPFGTGFEIGAAHLFEDRSSLEARFIRYNGSDVFRANQSLPYRQALNLDYNTILPISHLGLPLQARLGWRQAVTGDNQLTASARLSSNFRGWRWTHLSRLEFQEAGSNRLTIIGGRFGFTRNVGRLRIRGNLEYECAPQFRMNSFDIGAQRRFGRSGFGQLNLSHNTLSGQTVASASFTRNFGDFALSTSAGIDSRGDWMAGLRVSTALFFDRRKKSYRTAPTGLSRTGAIRATVYDDLNSDGQLDPKDEPIKGASFILDRSIRREETDQLGSVSLGSVESHRDLDLELALGSLSDPFLQPVEPGLAVTVRPGQVVDVDVPLTLTGEADGIVVIMKDDLRVPVAGVTVEAINSHGEIVATSNSEYDGYVYLEGLPMGQLEIRIASEALETIDASAESVNIVLNRSAPSATGLDLKITQEER